MNLKDLDVYVDLQGLIDVDAEIARNRKQEQKLLEQIAGKQKKLSNESFVAKAPADVVQQERAKLDELNTQLDTVRQALQRLQPRPK